MKKMKWGALVIAAILMAPGAVFSVEKNAATDADEKKQSAETSDKTDAELRKSLQDLAASLKRLTDTLKEQAAADVEKRRKNSNEKAKKDFGEIRKKLEEISNNLKKDNESIKKDVEKDLSRIIRDLRKSIDRVTDTVKKREK